MNYVIFHFKARNIMAIPLDSKAIKKNGYKYYKGTTVRRKIIRLLIRLSTWFNLECIVGYSANSPVTMYPEFDFEGWIKTVETNLGFDNLYAIVSFPSQPQRKRFYVNLLSENGEPLAFAKVSLDEENDRFLLNESDNMHRLSNNMYSFKIPRILSEDTFLEHRYIVFEHLLMAEELNFNNDLDDLKKYSDELADATYRVKSIKDLSWWEKFINEVPNEDREVFLEDIKLTDDKMVEVCLAHGDLHKGNICKKQNEIYIFDWEASCSDSPVMTDIVVSFLANNQRKIITDPIASAVELKMKFLNDDKSLKENLAMALAFLSTTGRNDAKYMISNWKYIMD